MSPPEGAVAGAAREGGSAQVLRKRHADESNLNDDQRFAKRFNLLSIGGERNGNSNYYIPVSSAPPPSVSGGGGQAQPAFGDEPMQVDDTRDRIYIHNLDEELAEADSGDEGERLIFLPDIEKRLSRIPQQVLTGRRDDESENQELVLYSVPKSLTQAEGHDSVRKVIIEARHRASAKAAEEARREDMNRKYDHSGHEVSTETAHGYSSGYEEEQADPDAMDIG